MEFKGPQAEPAAQGNRRGAAARKLGRRRAERGRSGVELLLSQGTGYQVLARLVSDRVGLAQLPQLARLPGGKPYFPACPHLQFSLSHSGPLVLCGLGGAPLGVDLEQVRPRRPGLARYICAPEEYAWYQAQGGGWPWLYTIWTLKEAKVKCTGQGLRRRPAHISVPLLRPGQAGELDGLRFRAYAGPGWRAAVCCLPPEQPPPHL